MSTTIDYAGPTAPAPQPTASSGGTAEPKFPHPLLDKIVALGVEVPTDTDTKHRKAKKFEILTVALANLTLDGPSTTSVDLLEKPENFKLTSTKSPDYFSQAFHGDIVKVDVPTANYYDYGQAPANQSYTWVDFANIELGGGVFGTGMVQEETMALEMPEFANLVAGSTKYTTREITSAPGKLPLESNPTPLLIKRVHQAIRLDHTLYLDGWLAMSVHEVLSKLHSVAPRPPEAFILAVAVPQLPEKNPPQKTSATINDLFNTFVAAYVVAKKDAGTAKQAVVNTGPIGTGVFNHDKEVVYVLQNLAAQQVGVDLRYWSGPTTDKKAWDAKVKAITEQYGNDKTKTVSHLLEIAHNVLNK